MIVIPGSNSLGLALKIAKELGVKTARASLKKFPDGETYVRIDDNLENEDSVIIQNTYPTQNDSIIEVALLADAARNAGARNITAVIPYVAYSRQNKIFQKGESIGLDVIIKLLKSSGISKLITVDAHFYRRVGSLKIDGLEIVNLSGARLLLDYVEKTAGKDLFVIGPDLGSSEMIEYATGILTVMNKEKICPNCSASTTDCKCGGSLKEYSVSEFASDIGFKGKDVVIMDDMIVSGSTIIKAAEKIKSEGAKSVSAVATHGLFLGDSLNILKRMTNMLVVTDSIPTDVSYVSIAGLIADAVKQYK